MMGFSTGALAKGNVLSGIEDVVRLRLTAIELSALRVLELDGLERAVEAASLAPFNYVSLHAPTDYTED